MRVRLAWEPRLTRRAIKALTEVGRCVTRLGFEKGPSSCKARDQEVEQLKRCILVRGSVRAVAREIF